MKARAKACQAAVKSPFPDTRLSAKCLQRKDGWVAEWFKAPVLKTGVGASPP